jgi:site-specific DNA recombinase
VKSRQGIETAPRQGRHAGGKPLYGYQFREERHPNPHKAAQGQKLKFLIPDPSRAPVVKMIFENYVTGGLTLKKIQDKLNSDLDRYPPPESPDPARRTGKWGRSSVWEILHNPKYTGYQVWNRRQRKKGGKINPSNKWIWSDEPAHESLVSREMFEKAALVGLRNDNNTKAAESYADVRQRSYALRSFLRCGICGLRMHGHFRRYSTYYVCETNRRQPDLVPHDHPKSVHLGEKKAAAKVVEFLQRNVFGSERLQLLKQALETSELDDEAKDEEERIQKELTNLRVRMKRLMASLEEEEPGSELMKDLKERLTELAKIRAKKERELEAARRLLAERPEPKAAESLVSALPLMEVDWELLSDEDFRDLLKTLNFEARYDPRSKNLNVQVTLIPELLLPNESGRSPLSFVPPAGFEPAASCSGGKRSIP